MNICLKGYFDKNFGDDVMQLMLVRAFPEYDFFVSCPQRELLSHFEAEKNVHINCGNPKFDALVYMVGTGFIINGKRAVLEYFLSKKEKAVCKKAAVIDCSVEKYNMKIAESIAKRQMKGYELISCRDEYSYSYFKSNFKNKEIECFPDVLFALDNIKSLTGENALGIVPVRRIYSGENYEYYKKLSETADEFIEKYGRKVILFAFDTETENDTAAANAVYNMSKNKNNIEIVSHNDDGTNVINAYARCGKIITSRFHGAVLALRYGIPVLGLADNLKLNILAKKYGFDIYEKSAFDVKKVKSFTDADIKTEPIYDSKASCHFKCLKEFLER